MRSAVSCGLLCAAALLPAASGKAIAAADEQVDEAAVGRFVSLALECVHREYPNKIAHTLASDADVRAPRLLTPAFYGCYDWHSAVHGHWLLARAVRLHPRASFAANARAALAKSLTPENITVEVVYLRTEGRAAFERPYGLAWLLQLVAELRSHEDADFQKWAAALQPLEQESSARIKQWLPKLNYPIRVGEHSQTAFAFGLIWDWAKVVDDQAMLRVLGNRARAYYYADSNCPLAYEPSGEDFLSPCLAEADFMRRILSQADFQSWLRNFLPGIPRNGQELWLPAGIVTDRSDPKLAHIDGLNLSRAWMLEGIGAGLGSDPRSAAMRAAAKRHRDAALPAVTGEHYEGGHWLGTFALYLTSGAGLPPRPAR